MHHVPSNQLPFFQEQEDFEESFGIEEVLQALPQEHAS
jgi:hypothetical protein